MINLYEDNYAASGVDIEAESVAMGDFLNIIRATFSFTKGKPGDVILDLGYFANVVCLEMDKRKTGIAISADGVGTKVLIAQMTGKYDTIGIDCVAMNVNDVICVGARPVSMLNYLAIQKIEESVLSEIAQGLYEGARQSGIAIPGGETAQVRDLIKGWKEGMGFDLAGMVLGIVDIDKIITGKRIRPGDLVLGLSSSGLHSNGFSLARCILLEKTGWSVNRMIPELGRTIGEELLTPTKIYVPFILDIIENVSGINALCHITGDGLLNLLRVDSQVAFIIDHIPEPPPIFKLIQDYGKISDNEMFQVFNMGIGFCIIAAPEDLHLLKDIAKRHNIMIHKIGYAIESQEKFLEIRPLKLKGKGRKFGVL